MDGGNTIDLSITGMTCAACATRVERAIKRTPGVAAASVNLATERARVTLAGADEAAVIAAVARAGYGAAPLEAPLPADRTEWWLVGLGAALTLPLLATMAGHMLPGWAELLLAAPVQLVVGWRFHRGAVAALRARAPNMDVLVSLGTWAAFLLSVADLFTGGPLYFESAAVVIVLVRLGKALEARARRRTGEALRALEALRPATAFRLADGRETEVPIAALRVGDLVAVPPGERIPVDGTVRAGESEADESLLTGESRPVPKAPGGHVVAGSLNGTGRLEIETTSLAGETMLARIVRLVEDAQAAKPPIQQLVDRVSAVFVPAVLALAALSFAAWLLLGAPLAFALVAAAAVLVVACPCALGLATPAAIVAGTGAAARAGILIADPAVLDAARGIRVVAFDKTGTLTEGRPRLIAAIPADGVTEPELLSIAAAIEGNATHPLAHAIQDAARNLAIPAASDLRALPGRGAEARVAGRRLALGSERLLAESGAGPGPLADAAARHASASLAWLIAPEEQRVLGLLAFADTPREGAREAVAELHRQGFHVAMLSGDHEDAARAVAATLGIEDVRAGLLPAEKLGAIAALREHGAVAMVGDGVNDAPALAAADLGIAVAGGSEAALHAAGITLLRADPRLVPASLAIARRTARTIRQGLFWAFAYNVLALPFAAIGLLSPMIAGGAMAASSVSVVLNALRLRRWKPG
jgi:P-type Cu+ transporter